MKKYENVPLESQLPQYERWAKIFESKQVGNLFFLPRTGMMYRLWQWCDWMGKKYPKAKVKIFDINEINGEVWEIGQELPREKENLVLILRNTIMSPDGMRVAREIEKWLINFEGLALIVHELVPSQLIVKTDWPSWVFANQMLYQLPKDNVVVEYAEKQAKEMGVKLDTAEANGIVEKCGSQLWLVNEILSRMVEVKEAGIGTLVKSNTFVQKMRTIWESWPEPYQKIVLGVSKDRKLLTEMQEIGIIDENGKMRGGELADFIARKKAETIKVSENLVEYDERDYTEKLTVGDRKVLAKLWESKELLTREEVAKLFWGDDSGYEATDWAIDQKMRRLRNKLAKLGLPIAIVTKKGEGYGIKSELGDERVGR